MDADSLVNKELWPLDPNLRYLNHGSFGATPIPVLKEQARLRMLNEHNPVNFALRETHSYVEAARVAVAEVVDADERGIVLCGNATEAVNTVLRGQDWRAGDEILMTSHGYPACWNTVQTQCTVRRGSKAD